MNAKSLAIAALACAVGVSFGTPLALIAQQPTPLARGTSADLNGLLASTLVFAAADANKDGAVTQAELTGAAEKWLAAADAANAGSVTRDQLATAIDAAMPMSGLAAAFNM